VQRVDHEDPLFEELAVMRESFAEPVDQTAYRRAFGHAVARFLEIEIVYDT
jgi:hypothetical protein